MKTKLKTSSENKLEKLLENNNFRNNQNYVLSMNNKILSYLYKDKYGYLFYEGYIDYLHGKSYYKINYKNIELISKIFLNIKLKIFPFLFKNYKKYIYCKKNINSNIYLSKINK